MIFINIINLIPTNNVKYLLHFRYFLPVGLILPVIAIKKEMKLSFKKHLDFFYRPLLKNSFIVLNTNSHLYI